MKILKKVGTYVFVFVFFISIYNYIKPEPVIQYVKNNKLECIREDWKGNVCFGDEFANSDKKDTPLMPLDVLKWKLSNKSQSEEKKLDTFRLEVIKNTDFIQSDKDVIVWLGHASFFIRINGKTLITDPVLGDVSFIKRLAGNACRTEELLGIDYLLLSHGHRDHFDKKTLKVLFKNNPNIEALIPLRLNSFFDKNNIKNQQAGWYQKYDLAEDFNIYFLPSKHWNRRGITDFNKNLWGSFLIEFQGKTIYFSGDTAYGTHFKEIGKLFPNIDYCLLSIGAYKPRHIMENSHMNPEEALQAFHDLEGKTFIPMHFGTYDLSDEPIGEPYRKLVHKNDKDIRFLKIGEIIKLDN